MTTLDDREIFLVDLWTTLIDTSESLIGREGLSGPFVIITNSSVTVPGQTLRSCLKNASKVYYTLPYCSSGKVPSVGV